MSRGKCENIERLKLTFELKILMTGKEFGRKFIEGGLMRQLSNKLPPFVS